MLRRKHYLRPGKDLLLDWRPLFKELKVFVLPSESGITHTSNIKRNVRTLTKLCTFAQLYFGPKEIPAMLEEFLPYFSTSFLETAFVVVGLLNLLLPTSPAPPEDGHLLPYKYLPTLFHLWSLVNRSKTFDMQFIDIFSRLARDSLPAEHVEFSEHGIFSAEQSAVIFSAILNLLEIPVGQSSSSYSPVVDLGSGLAVMLDRDTRKHPITHNIARWIVASLSPECLAKPVSILSHLEGLIQAVETFFHPSNSGSWTKTLSQLIYYLSDFFVMRWNREQRGEIEIPKKRRLNADIRKRFVMCLREVTFMGIFAKSGSAVNFALSTLQSLAFLEPTLILPGALQRIYPALQGLVEVHRTISSIRALQVLARVMSRTKGFRCHLTTLLGLALPGIDPNDLEKTLQTLSFIQAVSYNIPLHDLTKEIVQANDGRVDNGDTHVNADTALASQWITKEVERFDREGPELNVDYGRELDDNDERNILKSSTAGLEEFVIMFLGRVFTLLENLPDASRVRSGSPEENVVNTLPATFTPLLAALSSELYDLALNKIANFITNHVIHQARDAMAFICNALVKIQPRKALKVLLPQFIAGIRTEIDDNGAGSTRTTGSEALPRDRALVWNISLLSMCVVHVGDAVIDWEEELFDIAIFMQERCRGIPTVHVSNFIHHLLLNLTVVYTVDYSNYEPKELERGLSTEDWGKIADPSDVNIRWHSPTQTEINFAIKLFRSQTERAVSSLNALISQNPPVKRDGIGKDWSDEVSRGLVLLRLTVSGLSVLFDPSDRIGDSKDISGPVDVLEVEEQDSETGLGEAEDEDVKPAFRYAAGYPLDRAGDLYKSVHELRRFIGETLHSTHIFLIEKQEDDIQCFNALYNAYRSWFLDVGIERSAHVLDRVTRLLAADIHPFKFSGLRKEYPRSLLVRRANVYHLQRLRHNSNPRKRTDLDVKLLLDLAQSSVSIYTEIRRTAQTANESAVRCIIGARPLVIPPLLQALEKAVKESDFARIKGAMFSLLFGSLAKTIARDWRFTPSLIKSFIDATSADRPSVQKLASNATFQIMDMGKPLERMVILNEITVDQIAHLDVYDNEESIDGTIMNKRAAIQKKRARVESKKAKLANELVEIASKSHWKKASRTAAIAVQLGSRFETVASKEMIELVTKGAVDPHPNLRSLYAGALVGLFSLVQTRAFTKHDYKKYILGEDETPDKIEVDTQRDDPTWTDRFLQNFAYPEASYYVDNDHIGWLVWQPTMIAFKADFEPVEYDNVESSVRKHMGNFMNKSWFSLYFDYLKQEPRDSAQDRFRVSNALVLTHAFGLVFAGLTETAFEDLQELVRTVYRDGSDKHQHRATAEILGAMLCVATEVPAKTRIAIWEYAFPIVRSIFQDGLTPENSSYWTTFLHLVLQEKDPRRSWPLIDWLASFRLDMSSNAAFKESSKIQLLQQCIADSGWHFQLEKPILADFMNHLDHPYKGVREAMGHTIAYIQKSRQHESYKDIPTLIRAQEEFSTIGKRPYQPNSEFKSTMDEIFEKLEKWRQDRQPGQQTPSSYTSGSKTILLWLDSTLSSYECIQLVPFIHGALIEQLLHMMDIKEDPELQSLAYHVFRILPNVPHRMAEDEDFVNALVHIGQKSISWHQRLRVLLNMQVLYFRRLFLMNEPRRLMLYSSVADMLKDQQLEVRLGAAATLSGMIRCSPAGLRQHMVQELKGKFSDMLSKNPHVKRKHLGAFTPEQNKPNIVIRHAAVLGLGALIQAFPYTSPPPPWLPDVLATLALKASGDPGIVGKSVKSILADFKKTRQDTWHVDVKVKFFNHSSCI